MTTDTRLSAAGALSGWLAALDGAPPPPYTYRLVTGGRTNLTYQVTGADGRSVALRHLPDAGDGLVAVGEREFRILEALAAHDVPVPRPIARCTDQDVLGTPFSVLEWIDGRSIADADDARRLDPRTRSAMGRSFTDALATVHRLDLAEAGLADLLRTGSYADRQIRAWHGQAIAALHGSSLEADSAARLGEELDRAAGLLAAEQPPQSPPVLLHGDYRLDNVILSERGEVRAIVDWELAATGDPLDDLAYAVVMWEPHDSFGRSSPTSVPGFGAPSDLVEQYGQATGAAVDPVRFTFHVGLAAWRAACIGAVVFARYEAGRSAGAAVDGTGGEEYVSRYLEMCHGAIEAYRNGGRWGRAR